MPTITIGGRAGATFSGMQDLTLLSSFPNNNLPAETSSGQLPFLLRPDLSGIPAGSTITDAFWTINITSGAGGAFDVAPKRVLRAWVETEASWNNWATTPSAQAWTTPGALGNATDRVAAASCVLNYPGGFATGDVVSTSNTQLIADIQAIVGGGANNGWRFEEGLAVALPANATAALRPQLTVTYNAASGGEITGNATADEPTAGGGMESAAQLSGDAQADEPSAGGGMESAAQLSGNATVDEPGAAGGMSGSGGTLTSGDLKDNGVGVHSNAPFEARVYAAADGALVVRKTGLTSTTSATAPICSFLDAAVVTGQQYYVQWIRTDTGQYGIELLTAT